MNWRVLRLLVIVGAIVAMPVAGFAQDATLAGTVKDSTGGVLPGVTITATHTDSGNTFVAISDEAGAFRVPVRTGDFKITFELAGFATLTRTATLLLGQAAVVNLELAPSTVLESITVTGEAPLIDIVSSTVGGNIDPKQMQELPVNGRNWMDLSMLAPGSRQNQSGGIPIARQGYAQINVDGQQVTNNFIGSSDEQARFSRDSVGEFELITNRFDATQGRSMGMVANAITKSGTNTPSGTVGGYFRDSKFNAADLVQKRVLPYSNQQVSTTYGGPVIRNRAHIFANFEYEREPQVLVFSATGPLAVFNMDIPAPRKQWIWGLKGDLEFTSNNRLSIRGNGYEQVFYTGGGATSHPSTASWAQRFTKQVLGTWTTVLNDSTLNVLKVGYSNFNRNNHSLAGFKGGPNPDLFGIPSTGWGAPPRVTFTGYSSGAVIQHHNQDLASIRNDLTMSFSARGRHNVKTGGEYIYNIANLVGCGGICTPRLIAQAANASTQINALIAAFPVWNDTSTWNLNALTPLMSPSTSRFEATFTDTPGLFRSIPQDNIGVWIQDDWTIGPRLTVNMGVRYDFQNHIGAELDLPPFLPGAKPNDTNNIAPRLGFAYSLNDRSVIRGGYGLFYAQGSADEAHQTILYILGASPLVPYDGRADFPTNPMNGPAPNYKQILANSCDLNGNKPGCAVRQMIPEINSPFWFMPYSHQASIGLQTQIGNSMSYETNVVYTGGRGEEYSDNINLAFDPVTGANYSSNDVARRPLSQFGAVQMSLYEGRSNYYAWENSFTRRMTNHLQGSVTYTLAQFKDAQGEPYLWSLANGQLGRERLPFTVAPDLGSEYSLASSDQRHRAVFNGIWEAPLGLQVSGVYFYGSGLRMGTSYGGDRRQELAGGANRLRLANPSGVPCAQNTTDPGCIVPRNNFVGSPIHRVDLRLQKRISLGGRRSLDGIVELFNAFNHANYGSYTLTENSSSYGQPTFNNNISYGPRAVQLGFRFQF